MKKWKTKSAAVAKLEKMTYKEGEKGPPVDLNAIFELAYRLKKWKEASAQNDQQSFAA